VKTRAAFPLTPALSLREREKRSQCFGKTTAASCSTTKRLHENVQRLSLLPKGEGQDEGEDNDI
jgi:hypothetical protein